jgi:PAS domain S-box-containing protein
MKFQSKVVAVSGLAIAILVCLGVLSYSKISDDEKDEQRVDHTRSVIEALDALELQINKAESPPASGFSELSRRRNKTTSASEQVPVLIGRLRVLTADNQRQQQALDRLTPAVKISMSANDDQPGNPESVSARLKAGAQVQTTLADMKQEEQRLLAQRLQAAHRSSIRAKLFIVMGNGMALAFLLLSAVVVQRELQKRSDTQEALSKSEEKFRLMVSAVKDYAILMLDLEGRIASWNDGAERIKGYRAEEILGHHFSRFYLPEDVSNGKPANILETARRDGRVEDEGWRVRKDGTRFWADVVITALRDEKSQLRGFGKVTRDLTDKREAEEELRRRNVQLENANKELEAFSYSVSHDLRAPLRSIDGFSLALLEDCGSTLDENGIRHLERIRSAASRMGRLIDDMLNLARISRSHLVRDTVNLSRMAQEVLDDLKSSGPERGVSISIAPDLVAAGDRNLLRIALQNLLGNAWKFTSRCTDPRIEFGRDLDDGQIAFFVRDNGEGFDMQYADKLFGVFQRLHRDAEYPGTGVGLATVQRIIRRHGGSIWAKSAPGEGATFYFVL